ncbi:GDSL-type esterase/lipase family protein [Muricoccus radiodurans]|uniref:DUF459 domain-containing protein n=1 Tax=Muricoccus radiodurans TaxID=2231721 RepID=UPI003CF7BCF8
MFHALSNPRAPRAAEPRPACAAPRRAVLATLGALLAGRASAEDEAPVLAIYGDSQAQGLSASLRGPTRGRYRLLNRTKPATGVAQAAYDWVQALRDSVAADRPAVAIMMFGANDRVPARLPDGRNLPFRGEPWLAYYRERIAAMVRVLSEAGVLIVWCGNPLSREQGYARDMAYLNDLFRQALPEQGAVWVDLWNVASDANGAYQSHGAGVDGRVQRLRNDDGIHFTTAGYDLVARRVMQSVDGIVAAARTQPAAPPAAPPPAAAALPPPAATPPTATPPAAPPAETPSPSAETPAEGRGAALRGIGGALGMAMLVLAGCDTAPPPRPPVSAAGLAPFHAALAELESGTRREPVVVLQLGDSHSANDAFGTRMREGLGERFGLAGRGPLAPGVPFRTYDPSLVRVTADPGWQAIGSLSPNNPGPFGIAGVRQRADAGGATMTLETQVEGGLARAEVEVLRQPGGGGLEVTVDGRPAGRIGTDGAGGADFIKLPTSAATRQVTLRSAGDGPVELLGWSAARESAGILYANLGTIGATIDTARRWDPAIVRTELAHLRPSLILVAFGTNEGFREELDVPAYARRYAETVRAWQAAAPGAAVVVMGPADGDWRAGRPGPRAAEECPEPGRGWRKPPNLSPVREAQRAVARENGWHFWDWSAAMGGNCAMHRWTEEVPPLAAPDHVHLRSAGYRRTAESLLRDLLEGYDRQRRSGAPRV